jgi:hypothetical protein
VSWHLHRVTCVDSLERLFDAAANSCVQESKNRTVGSAVAGLVPCHPRAHSGD